MGNAQPRAPSRSKTIKSPVTQKLEASFTGLLQNQSSATQQKTTVTEEDFHDAFSGPSEQFGRLVYHYGLRTDQSFLKLQQLTKSEYVAIMLPLYSAVIDQSKSELLEVMFDIFSGGQKMLSKADTKQLVNICCVLSLASSTTATPDGLVESSLEQNAIIQSFQEGLMAGNDELSADVLSDWLAVNAPCLFDGIQSWLKKTIDHSKEFYVIPQLKNTSQQVVSSAASLDAPAVWLLSTVLPHCYSQSTAKLQTGDRVSDSDVQNVSIPCFSLLYDSQEQGHSFNRFERHVFGYRGPTFLILRLQENLMFLIASDTDWRDSPAQWGATECLLLQMTPMWNVIDSGSKLLYYHSRSGGRHRGLIVGKDLNDPLISTEDLGTANVKLHKSKPQQSEIPVMSVEVWGCGSAESTVAQKSYQKWEQRQVEKQRKVKLPGRWEDNPDRTLLELAGRTVEHGERPDI